MKILFIDETAKIGGAEINLLSIADALLGVGRPVKVILPDKGPLHRRLVLHRIPVAIVARPRLFSSSFYIGERLKLPNPIAVLLNIFQGVRWIARLSRMLRSEGPAIVQTISMWAHAFGGLAGKMAGMPVVWHFQDIVDPSAGLGLYRRMVAAFARFVPDRIICISEEVRRQFSPDEKILAKCELLWNAIPADAFKNDHADRPVNHHPFRIGTVARFTPWKGIDIALNAAGMLNVLGVDFEWEIAGEETLGEKGYRRILAERRRELGLDSCVQFVGWQEDMPAFYARLDALVHLPISPEPFGLVLLEAMAAGLPVITTDHGGAAAIVQAAGGKLVPPGRHEPVAEILRAWIDNPAAGKILGAQAAVHVEKNFSIRHYMDRLDKLYSDLERSHAK